MKGVIVQIFLGAIILTVIVFAYVSILISEDDRRR